MARSSLSTFSWLAGPVVGEVLVMLFAIACYTNSLQGDFVHDDIFAIKDNQDIRPETPIRNVFVNDFWGTPMSSVLSHKSYRPLCVLTFRLNYLFSGLTSSHYHLTNIIFHAAASLLFMRFAHEVVFLDRVLATLSAVLFAVHPVHTEAVTGVVGRADVLACLLSLAAFILYYRSSQRSAAASTTNWPLLIASIVCGGAAMLCKEQGITVLGICLVYDWLVKHGILSQRKLISPSAVLEKKQLLLRTTVVLSSIIGLLAFRLYMLNGKMPGFTDQDNPASFAPDLSTRVFTFAYLWAFNGNLLTTPVVLSYDWQMGSIPLLESVTDPRHLATLLTFSSLSALSWHALFRSNTYTRRVLLLSLSFLVLPFLPASNLFFRVGFVVAERILYLPSIGFSLLVVFGLNELATWYCGLLPVSDHAPASQPITKSASVQQQHLDHQEQKPTQRSAILLCTLFACLILAMAGKTVLRNPVWWTRESLFRSGLAVVPQNAKVHYNFANFLKDAKRSDEAADHYRMALRLYPNHPSACNNLGTIIDDQKEAEQLYRRATELNPRHSNAYFNLGGLLRDQGRLNESENAFRQSLKIDEKYDNALGGLASVLEQQGKFDLALSTLQHAITLHPDNADFHHNMAVYYGNHGDAQKSLSSYEKALQLKPRRHITLMSYAKQLRQMGHNEEAERFFKRALKVKRDADSLLAYGTMLHNLDRHDEAEKAYLEALKVDPKHYNSTVNLAVLKTTREDFNGANRLFMSAIEDNPSELSAYKHLMSLQSQTDRHSSVLKVFNEARSQSVPNAEVYDIHARALHALNRTGDAIKSWSMAVKLNPSFGRAHMNLGACYHTLGNYPRARHHYETALKLEPESQVVKENLVKLARLEKKSRK